MKSTVLARLALLALLVATACSGSATSPQAPSAAAPAAAAGRAHRFHIGDLEAYALSDGHLVLPNDGQLLGFGRPPAEIADLLAAAGLPRDTIRLDVQSLLVKTTDRVILFDAGTGDPAVASTGQLPHSLARAGIAPTAITDIFISHAHSDHMGGLITTTGSLAFPSATIHLSAPEWTAFQAATDDDSKRYVAAIARNVQPFEPGAQVLPAVRAVATPGHTPGHSSYEISSGADRLFYLGDVAHHSVISVQRPAWSIQVDADHAAAAAIRQATFATLAADTTRVFAFHFPFPGIGHVLPAAGQAFLWKPDV